MSSLALPPPCGRCREPLHPPTLEPARSIAPQAGLFPFARTARAPSGAFTFFSPAQQPRRHHDDMTTCFL